MPTLEDYWALHAVAIDGITVFNFPRQLTRHEAEVRDEASNKDRGTAFLSEHAIPQGASSRLSTNENGPLQCCKNILVDHVI